MNYLMTYLTKKVQWATWQFSVIKLAAAVFGILLGYYFYDFWKQLLLPLWIVFVATSIWASVMWFSALRKKMKVVMQR